jgi:hypothetical protein
VRGRLLEVGLRTPVRRRVLQKLSSANGAVGIQLPSFWSRKDQIKQLFYLLLSRRDLPQELWPWEIIADNLSKAGWRLGCVSALDSHGRTIWITDAHRDDGKRFVVHADEKLTAFLELESAIRAAGL